MTEFTADWFTHNIPNWEAVLAPLRDESVSVLEIGSYEGRSAVFFLEFLPKCRITCIDPFMAAGGLADGYEDRFDANTAPFGDRVRKIKGHSVPVLNGFCGAGERFDVIYIDGDHNRHPTFSDTVLAWPLLKVGGVLIWDDYAWRRQELPAESRPEGAIDLFLAMFASCLTELHRGYQVIVRKHAEWPQSIMPSQYRHTAIETKIDTLKAEVVLVKKEVPEIKAKLSELNAILMQIRDRPLFVLPRWLRPPKRVRNAINSIFRPHQV